MAIPAGNCTITLPGANALAGGGTLKRGMVKRVKRVNATDDHAVTVVAGGTDTFNSGTGPVINVVVAPGATVTFVSDGISVWHVLS